MKEEKILINGMEVNYKMAGEGKPLLILHGWGGSSDSWVKVQERLAQNGYKVICPDLPGFGKSSRPPRVWGTEDYTNFVSDFVKKIDFDRFFLIGHSFGGGLAIRFVANFPQRIRALAICDTAYNWSKKRYSFRQIVGYIMARVGAVIFSIPILKEKVYPYAKKIVYKITGTYDYYLAEGVMKETIKKVFAEDLTRFLSQIKTPTLIVWGKKDKSVPLEDGFSLSKTIPGSKLKIIDGVGHSPHWKIPEKLSEILLEFFTSIV